MRKRSEVSIYFSELVRAPIILLEESPASSPSLHYSYVAADNTPAAALESLPMERGAHV